jgi:hypothetical protein
LGMLLDNKPHNCHYHDELKGADMIIYGAGMAGLLAANVLRRFNPIVKEAKPSLPNNHAALLRFRSPSVGDSCGVPFSKVNVKKAICYEGKIYNEPNIFFSNKYSLKVTGAITDRSINNLDNAERYIAPLNLISLMAANCNIEYKEVLSSVSMSCERKIPLISTIPMPTMMDIVGWGKKPNFRSKPIWSQTGLVTDPDVNVYQTIYYPDPIQTHYRVSVIGNIIIAEHSSRPEQNAGPTLMGLLRDDFGIDAKTIDDIKQQEQKYGKILPIEEKLRKEFIFHLTEEYGIFSLGRFATWRQLILDDVVKDVAVVERLIDSDSIYDISLYRSERNDQ